MEAEREQALSVYRRVVGAWNRRDPDAFASLFAESGTLIGLDGSQISGRTEIGATLRAIFDDHVTSAYVAKLREIRPLAPGVTLLRAVVGMIPPGGTEPNPAAHAVQSMVVAKEAGRPRIVLLHSSPVAFQGHPHLGEKLTEELSAVARQGQVVGGTV